MVGYYLTVDFECVPMCGDGTMIAPEECDDGNLESGDGCVSKCVVEDGYDASG